jgi:hypothetical protein
MKYTKTTNANAKYPKPTNTKAPITKPNAERAWKQFEDHLIPRLRLSVIDRSVYSHLLRHSRLGGKWQLRFSIFDSPAVSAFPSRRCATPSAA